MKYVVGFLFNKLCTEVALILKQRPEWQKDRFNGMGGKFTKATLNPDSLMMQKSKKESGKEILNWEYFAELKSPQNTIFCYCAADEDDSLRIRNMRMMKLFRSSL